MKTLRILITIIAEILRQLQELHLEKERDRVRKYVDAIKNFVPMNLILFPGVETLFNLLIRIK
jgi:hypothetical protein